MNHCYDYLRKNSVQFEASDTHLIEKQHPEKILLKQEQLQHLNELLEHLEQTEYFILLLRYVNELSYDEIAEIMQIPLNEVRNKLHRSKRKLRQLATTKGGYFLELQ